MQAQHQVYPKESLPAKLGEILIAAQNKTLKEKPFFDIGISGGSQAPALAAALVGNPEVKWKQWRVWLVDERIVPLDHKDSNWHLFEQHVLSKLPESERPQGFHLSNEVLAKGIDQTPSAEFAAAYQKVLVEHLGPKPSVDVAVLGMGPDGHTCSLFPGHELLNEEKLLIASLDDSPKPPPRRITFTFPTLRLAKQVVFYAAGTDKKPAIDGIFDKHDEKLPAYRVMRDTNATFLTDQN